MYSNNSGYYGTGGYTGYGAITAANISYETNSKDPILQRARVFVGNLMTSKVGREEIIQMFQNYGKLLGVTVFKGYAFVQFSHGSEADLAVSALNGYNWNGGVLDVKLAVHGQNSAQTGGGKAAAPSSAYSNTNQQFAPRGTGKRNQPDAAAKDLKRMKIEHGVNNVNKTYAAENSQSIEDEIQQNEIPDTLICGECRFLTHSLADFVDHRKAPCKLVKADGEPSKLNCISCDEEFTSSWNLLNHHNLVHMRPLFRESSSNGEKLGMDEQQQMINVIWATMTT